MKKDIVTLFAFASVAIISSAITYAVMKAPKINCRTADEKVEQEKQEEKAEVSSESENSCVEEKSDVQIEKD